MKINQIFSFVILLVMGINLQAEDKPSVVQPLSQKRSVKPDNAGTIDSRSALADVEKRPVVIFSDGTRMAGDLYLPKERKPDEKFPAIVLCAGTGGTKGGTQARVAPIFARNGYVVLAFDYRGWGESESQLMAVDPQPKPDANNELTIKVKALRWQMNYTDQTEDIRAAMSFVAGEPQVDKERIALWGSSYGGGLVTTMAAIDARVKCVAAQVPGMGGRSPRAVTAALDLHTQQARGEIEPVPIETGKMTGKMERYSNRRVNPAKSVGFNAVESAERITSPIIFLVAENEELSNNSNVEAVHQGLLKRGIPSEYHVIKGITHYGIYREGFEEATKLELEFFNKHLKGLAAKKDDAGKQQAQVEPSKPKPAEAAVVKPQAEPMNNQRPKTRSPAEVFNLLDADKNGKLTRDEMKKLQETVKAFKDNPQALDQFFKRLDQDQNGELTLEEYQKVTDINRPKQGNSNAPQSADQSRPEIETDNTTGMKKSNTTSATKIKSSQNSSQLAHFEKNIRPVLIAQCYSCHSVESKDIKGGLLVDTREGLLNGGDSGPAVVPGNVEKSLLISAIKHSDGLEMPPKSKLTNQQIADFELWIKTGAIDPREGGNVSRNGSLDQAEAREFWSFKKPVSPVIKVDPQDQWSLTEIDRIIRESQLKHGVKVVGDAKPQTLIRRLYFDLTGLPPSPEEINQFVTKYEKNSEQTLSETVDRLLQSPRFGERWGRHWLDVARYAESSGKETSFSYPQAWRYRDYVIDALNQDLPFNQFIKEQLAGDLLPAENEHEQARLTIATGYLALGPKSHIERNKKQFEMDLVDEQIDAMSQAFLGMTVACARCHDHKFDPISQTDYYALAGIFRSTETLYGTIPLVQNSNPSDLIPLPAASGYEAGLNPLSSTERKELEQQIAELQATRKELAKNKEFATTKFLQTGILLSTYQAKLAAYHPDGTPKILAMGVRDKKTPQDSELYIRGEVEKPGAIVPRGFIKVLCEGESPEMQKHSGRLELAEWIAAENNPLTARVIVNRIWLNLFGQGIVTTPDNFGISGQQPSNQDLLDHLAINFMKQNWSIKTLIREIVLSRVYRLDNTYVTENHDKDPDNVWLWRMSPRRLDADAIRDAMLLTAGILDLTPPQGSVVAEGGEGYVAGLDRAGQLLETKFRCRSVYLPSIRGRAFESLDVFDGVDGSLVTGQREQTTVPAQSLYLLNSSYVQQLALSAAAKYKDLSSDPQERINLAYQSFFGRSATKSEQSAAIEFVNRYREQISPARSQNPRVRPQNPDNMAWGAFIQSLWASTEFLVRK